MNGCPGYRCRHGYDSTRPRPANAEKSLYRRKDHALDDLGRQLGIVVREPADGKHIAVHLRAQSVTVVCERASDMFTGADEKEPDPDETFGGSQIELFALPMG